jgi:excisionase family DNA binding protein
MESPSMTTAAAAEILGVSAQTVQKWVDSGHLRAWRTVGGHRRIDAASVEEMVRTRNAAADAQAKLSARGGADVLIAEDNELASFLLKAQVTSLLPHASIELLPSGISALVRIGRRRPALLISDIAMPGLDGVDMARQLRADPATSSMPLVLVTAHPEHELGGYGPVPHDVPLLHKPISNHALLAALKRVMPATTAFAEMAAQVNA